MIGGGFAGLRVARELPPSEMDVTLVSADRVLMGPAANKAIQQGTLQLLGNAEGCGSTYSHLACDPCAMPLQVDGKEFFENTPAALRCMVEPSAAARNLVKYPAK